MVEDWIMDLRLQGRSPATIRSYRSCVSTLPETLTARSCRSWLAQFEIRKPATRYQKYSAASAYCRWLVAEGELEANPFDNIPRPRVPEPVLQPVTPAMLKKMLDRLDRPGFLAARNRAILLVLAWSGLRLAELHSLTVSVLDTETLSVVGKGDKPRDVPIPGDTLSALRRYARARRRQPYAELDALWIGRQGQLSMAAIYSLIVRLSEQCGYEDVTPHSFRRGFATTWLDRGGSESSLMSLAGWTSTQMVRRYTKAHRARLAADEFRRVVG